MTSSFRSRLLLAGFCAALAHVLAVVPIARAEGTGERERAREANERGTLAYQGGDYVTAAREYVLVDQLAPNAASLRAALDAALHANDPVIGETLLARLATRPTNDETLVELGVTAQERFAHRTARIRFQCPAGCRGTVDGNGVDTTLDTFVLPGPHLVSFQVGNHDDQRLLRAKEDEIVSVGPAGAAPPTTAASGAPIPAGHEDETSSQSKLSPGWFFLSLGVAGVLGVGTALSAADTVNKHNEFQAAGCASVGSQACDALGSDGSSAQLRTNVLLGVMGAAAVTTAVLGLVFVRWPPRVRRAVAFGVGPCAFLATTF